jgi:hypothetical protein
MTAEQLAEAAGLRYGVELEFVGPPFPNVHQAIRRAVDPHELIRAHRHTEKLTAWAHDTETCIYPAPGQGTGQEVKNPAQRHGRRDPGRRLYPPGHEMLPHPTLWHARSH